MSSSTDSDPSANSGLTVWIAAAAISLMALLYFVFAATPDADFGQAGRHPSAGRKPKLVVLEPLGGDDPGKAVTLDSLAGKVVVLNFWATWCPPCKEELPLLADYAHRMRDKTELAIVPIVYEEIPTDTREWLAARLPQVYKPLGVSLTSYFDPNALTYEAVMNAIGDETVFPTTVVLDQTGAIRGVFKGFSPRDFQSMTRMVDGLLNDKTAKKAEK